MADTSQQLLIQDGALAVPRAFFAYPSQPYAQAETVREAASKINETRVVNLRTWEDMSVAGKNVVAEICREISEATIFCADITGLNPNVMFELGYAIARDKRIWLIFDTSFAELRKQFDQLGVLVTTGYAQYANSEDIFGAFFRDKPYDDVDATIYRQSIQPTLSSAEGQILLYLKSRHDTNASNKISKVVRKSEIPLIVHDPSETGVAGLSWYGQKCYAAGAVVAHLLSNAREGSLIINAKYALIAGLAHGLGTSVLMLAEPEYVAYLDYRELLYTYKSANQAESYLTQWLSPIEKQFRESVQPKDQYLSALSLEVELRKFYVQIGEYLAENEAANLSEYYLETTAYQEAMNGSRSLFIGRKGTGKTANLVALASELKKNNKNIICIIQPVGYEIESLVKLFSLYRERDTKGYVIESLWKFLLLTEIAHAAVEQIRGRPLWVQLEAEEEHLIELLELDDSIYSGDFAVRPALVPWGETTS